MAAWRARDMTPFMILLMSSALLSGALYLWSRCLLLSWLVGAVVPCFVYQWVDEYLHGPDAFRYWAIAVTVACTLFVDILLLAVLAYVAAEEDE